MKRVVGVIIFILNTLLNAMDFSEDEKIWLKENRGRKFTVSGFNMGDYFLYKSEENNELKGVYHELLKRFQREYKIKFDFQPLERSVLTKRIEECDIDIVFKMAKNESREKQYNYIPMHSSYKIILISSSEKHGKKLENFKEDIIGIVENSSERNLIEQKYPEDSFRFLYVKDIAEGMEKLKNGETGSFIAKTINLNETNYHINFLDEFPRQNLQIGVAKKHGKLSEILDKYLNEESKTGLYSGIRKNRIDYYKEKIQENPNYSYIKENYKELTVYLENTNANAPLYSMKNGNYYGYIPDNIRDMERILEIPIRISSDKKAKRSAEIMGLAVDGINSEKKHILVNSYYEANLAAVGRKGTNFIRNTEDLADTKVGVALNYEDLEGLKIYPSYKEAFNGLKNKETDYIIGDFRTMSLAIRNTYNIEDIMVLGFLNKSINVGYGVSNEHPEIAQIIQYLTSNLYESELLEEEMQKNIVFRPDYFTIFTTILVLVGIIWILSIALFSAHLERKRSEGITNALIESFEEANRFNDEDTGMHTIRLNYYSKLIASEMECPKDFVKSLGRYASLHDVGKLGIPHEILKKPGKLTQEEFEEMKKHVEFGYRLVKKMKLGKVAENIALYHHEKWNGKGYIMGLKENEIPLEARIVTLVDIYDALRQKRVYKEGFSHKEAVEIILSESGISLDPKLVDIFKQNHEKFESIFQKLQ